jgi:hypothetical protein
MWATRPLPSHRRGAQAAPTAKRPAAQRGSQQAKNSKGQTSLQEMGLREGEHQQGTRTQWSRRGRQRGVLVGQQQRRQAKRGPQSAENSDQAFEGGLEGEHERYWRSKITKTAHAVWGNEVEGGGKKASTANKYKPTLEKRRGSRGT